MTYMNHELLTASFRYALEYENSFQVYCKLQSVQSGSKVNSL